MLHATVMAHLNNEGRPQGETVMRTDGTAHTEEERRGIIPETMVLEGTVMVVAVVGMIGTEGVDQAHVRQHGVTQITVLLQMRETTVPFTIAWMGTPRDRHLAHVPSAPGWFHVLTMMYHSLKACQWHSQLKSLFEGNCVMSATNGRCSVRRALAQ
jgi:hypothetical protein